jgi:hypothetical protein
METEIECVKGCNCKRFIEDVTKRNNGTIMNPICICKHSRTMHKFTVKR